MARTVHRTILPSSPALLMAMACLIISCLLLFLSLFIGQLGQMLLVVEGLLSFAVVAGAIWFRKDFDALEPITFVAISVFVGATLRSIYLVVSPATSDHVAFLIGNMSLSELAQYEGVIPISLLFFSLGYVIWTGRFPLEKMRSIRTTVWPRVRMNVFIAFFLVMGAVGTIGLIKVTNVSFASLAALSAKRVATASPTAGPAAMEEGATGNHAGYLRWLAKFVDIGTLLLYTSWAFRKGIDGKPKKFGLLRTAVICGLVSACMVWPIISSSRTSTVEIVFTLIVVNIYLRNRGKSWRFIKIGVIGALFALVVLIGMGLWRGATHETQARDETGLFQHAVDQTVGSGDFFPAERTAYIMAHYKHGEYYYGASYASWVFAPIPKSVWSDRPDLNMDAIVKGTIYQRDASINGYPPGMLGEAYMNFGLIGLLIVPFFLGILLRLTYNSFRPLLGVNRNATLIYASVLWPIGMQTPDLDFSSIMVNGITAVVPLVFAFWFMTKPARFARGARYAVA